ncbi:hypothetical protein MVEN_00335400 [Mycena venus]|uniref:Uncharacterized protein n=1 Tax=Mycena venus TaxID=2733690 RepID=A0A8H7D718_9AGAR|nr:hypothetical protein MVEN_00335400 [Mycena venus]
MSTRPEVPSQFSFYTESTVPSTVWGPGTFSGRAIMALGETTLKVLDRIIDREALAIQWRLGIIRRTAPGNLTSGMYDDLIELSRPDIYPESMMVIAVELLFRQLEEGYGAKVAFSLVQLPVSEAHLVLHELLTSRENGLLSDWAEASQFSRYGRDWGPDPTLDFLANLVQLRPEMTSVCCAVVEHLARNPKIAILFLRFPGHPILRIQAEKSLNIPLVCRTPLAKLQLTFSVGDLMYRWNTWKALEDAGYSAERQLLKIDEVLLNTTSTDQCWNPDFFDAAVDLFDFILHSRVPELHRVAIDHLIACLAVRNSWEPLRLVLGLLKGRLKVMCNFGNSPQNLPFRMVKLYHPLLCEFFRCDHPIPRDMAPDSPTTSALEIPLSSPPPHLLKPKLLEAIPETDETCYYTHISIIYPV